MLPYLLLFSLLHIVMAFDPPCSSCKHFVSNKRGTLDLGLCKLFTIKVSPKEDSFVLPNFALRCRNDEKMCGKFGSYYEAINPNNTLTDVSSINELDADLVNELDLLQNKCCGEVNEDDELEQLEREFFEVFQKIKKHNKKRIYKTSQELYKLFKKK